MTGLLGSGFVTARFSHRWGIVTSGTGIGSALLAVAWAEHLWTVRMALIGVGLAAGLYMPSAIATITALIERKHWGKAIAVHELAPNLAFFLSPFVAELFLAHSSWRAALASIGVIAISASAAYHFFGRGGDFPGESPGSTTFVELIKTRTFWFMIVLFGLGVSSTIGVYAMLPLYLVQERQLDQSWAHTLVAFSRLHGPVLGLIGGWVADKLGLKTTTVVSLLFSGVLTLLLGLAGGTWLAVAVLLQPLLAVWFFPAAFAILALIAPPSARNLSVSFTLPFGFVVGGGLVPTFIGAMGDLGNFALGFIITGALIALGGVLALSLRLPREQG